MSSNLSPEQFSLYRAEDRHPDESLDSPSSVGVHWTNRPIDYAYGIHPGNQRVVWHAKVGAEHVADTTDKYNEGEVVLRHGAEITLHGRSVTRSPRGHVEVSETPEVPMNRRVSVSGRQIK